MWIVAHHDQANQYSEIDGRDVRRWYARKNKSEVRARGAETSGVYLPICFASNSKYSSHIVGQRNRANQRHLDGPVGLSSFLWPI